MLTQLATVKARLGIMDTTDDALLTTFIASITGRADNYCNRTLARTVGAIQEFEGDDTEIRVKCYPIETVASWDLKSTEAEGWVAVSPAPDFVIRAGCVLSLPGMLAKWSQIGRVTYTGGFVMPGDTPAAGQTALPAEVEGAAIEQVAYWYQNRSRLGVTGVTTAGGSVALAKMDLLATVEAVFESYKRWLN